MPARFSAPLANQSVVIGSRAVVECHAIGDAPVTVRWFRNQRNLEREHEQRFKVRKDGDFFFLDTLEFDSGRFGGVGIMDVFADVDTAGKERGALKKVPLA